MLSNSTSCNNHVIFDYRDAMSGDDYALRASIDNVKRGHGNTNTLYFTDALDLGNLRWLDLNSANATNWDSIHRVELIWMPQRLSREPFTLRKISNVPDPGCKCSTSSSI